MFVLKTISVLMILILTLCSTEAFKFEQCYNSGSKFHSAQVSACPDASGPHCLIKRGVDVQYSVNFSTAQAFNDADLYLSFDIYGSDPVRHACDYGVKCPSKVGQEQRLVVVDKIFMEEESGEEGNYTIQVLGEKGLLIFCLHFPAKTI